MRRSRAARFALAAAGAFCLGLATWVGWEIHQATPPPLSAASTPPAAAAAASPPAPAPSSTAAFAPPSTSLLPAPPPAQITLADDLHSPRSDAARDVRIVAELVDAFASAFRENPVGDNADITAALAGRNREHLAFLPSDHPAIDAEGRLRDRFGTPYFFHALSARQMEIRSAGPDRRLFTVDDVLHSPAAELGAPMAGF